MRRQTLAVFGAGLILGAAGAVAATIGASGLRTARAAEKSYSKVVLENDRVIVKEAVFMPGDRSVGMHTHKYPHVGVVIDGGTLKFNYPDGKTETMNLQRGGAGFRDSEVTHEAVNTGTEPVRVIEVEVK